MHVIAAKQQMAAPEVSASKQTKKKRRKGLRFTDRKGKGKKPSGNEEPDEEEEDSEYVEDDGQKDEEDEEEEEKEGKSSSSSKGKKKPNRPEVDVISLSVFELVQIQNIAEPDQAPLNIEDSCHLELDAPQVDESFTCVCSVLFYPLCTHACPCMHIVY